MNIGSGARRGWSAFHALFSAVKELGDGGDGAGTVRGRYGQGTGTVTEIGDGWGRSQRMPIEVFGGNTGFRGDGTGTVDSGHEGGRYGTESL